MFLHYMNSVLVHVLFCSSSSTMSPDELVYLGVLAASIPVGFLFRYLSECLRMKPFKQRPQLTHCEELGSSAAVLSSLGIR